MQARDQLVNVGAWQAVGVPADGCAGQAGTTSLYRYELIIVPGSITINFLNAKATGPIADDGSFSVPLVYTPPAQWDSTMKGKVDSTGGVTGTFEELSKSQPQYGCSFPFAGGKVS